MIGQDVDLKKIESKVYEILGVKQFRKLVLSFEAIKHRKDGLLNENYHIKGNALHSLESFSGYLVFNALFHVASLMLATAYYVIKFLFHAHYEWIDIPMFILVIVNLYCIMLQRYIYVKISLHINKANKKKEHQLIKALNNISSILNNKSSHELIEEYEMILKLNQCKETGGDCFIADEYAETLERLASLVSSANIYFPHDAKESIDYLSIGQLIANASNRSNTIGTIERQVSRLQCFFRREKKNNVLFNYSFITESARCDTALCHLFPVKTRKMVDWTITILTEAYKQKGLAMQCH